jgi:hypothetical protein
MPGRNSSNVLPEPGESTLPPRSEVPIPMEHGGLEHGLGPNQPACFISLQQN